MHKTHSSAITILGAGPAGITAAIELGKKNIPCLLVDENLFPRPKICGDGLSGNVLKILDKIDPSLNTELNHSGFITGSRAVRFYSPAIKTAQIEFPLTDSLLPAGFVCKRSDFDQFLLKKALGYSSVSFAGNTRIHRIRYDQGSFFLENESYSWVAETKLLLIASGANHGLLHSAGIAQPEPKNELVGIRAYFQPVAGFDHQNAIELHFLREVLPCYLWIFPHAHGLANVGLALPSSLIKKRKISLKKLLFELIDKYPHLKERFSNAILEGKAGAHRLPYYTGKHQIAGTQYMLLGDAARLIDPFTGEGISNAMASGMIAAEVAASCYVNNDFSHRQTALYQEKVYQKLSPELSLGLRLHHLAKSHELLNLVIGRASKNPKVRLLLQQMLFNINNMEKLKKPMFYLKLALRI